MSLGRKDGEYSNNSELVFLSPRAKKDKKDIEPQFFIRRKIEGEWKEDGSTDRFSGNLTKVEHKTVVLAAPSKPMQLIAVTLDDPESNERYIAEFTFKVCTRSLFNRLLNLDGTDNVEISYFRNSEGWESFAVRQNNETVKAKYEKGNAKVPEVDVTTKKDGSVEKDYFDVNQFYTEEMVGLGESLSKQPKAAKKELVAAGSDHRDVSGEEDDSSIPF